jgi:hypothetical protein
VKYEIPTTYQSKAMTKAKVFEKKVKFQGQKVKVMVSNKKPQHKKYKCEI